MADELQCTDCGGDYVLDTVIPSETWNQIAPDGGLLCTRCIDRRLQDAGLTAEARFYYAGHALVSRLYPEDQP